MLQKDKRKMWIFKPFIFNDALLFVLLSYNFDYNCPKKYPFIEGHVF